MQTHNESTAWKQPEQPLKPFFSSGSTLLPCFVFPNLAFSASEHLQNATENRHILSSPHVVVVVYRRKPFITGCVHSTTSCSTPARLLVISRPGLIKQLRLLKPAEHLRRCAADKKWVRMAPSMLLETVEQWRVFLTHLRSLLFRKHKQSHLDVEVFILLKQDAAGEDSLCLAHLSVWPTDSSPRCKNTLPIKLLFSCSWICLPRRDQVAPDQIFPRLYYPSFFSFLFFSLPTIKNLQMKSSPGKLFSPAWKGKDISAVLPIFYHQNQSEEGKKGEREI